MAQKSDVREREHSKFVESPSRPGESAVEVVGTFASNQFSPPNEADAFTRSVAGNTETIEFRQGGISGTILKTIKIYYQKPPSPNLTGGEII